jgi:hypothetical protein
MTQLETLEIVKRADGIRMDMPYQASPLHGTMIAPRQPLASNRKVLSSACMGTDNPKCDRTRLGS